MAKSVSHLISTLDQNQPSGLRPSYCSLNWLIFSDMISYFFKLSAFLTRTTIIKKWIGAVLRCHDESCSYIPAFGLCSYGHISNQKLLMFVNRAFQKKNVNILLWIVFSINTAVQIMHKINQNLRTAKVYHV